MPTRLFGSCLLAGGVTLALFWAMTLLIASEDREIRPVTPTVVHIVKVMSAQPIVPKPKIVPIRHEIDEQPMVPTITTDPGEGFRVGPGEQRPLQSYETTRGKFIELGQSDGDATPIVRIAPRYPDRALARGLEGRVLVEFTISPSGSVEDARVIASEPRNVFDKAALDAVKQWKYTPKIENGRSVERRGLRISIPFRRGAGDSA